jgi:hypothetical protein
MQARVALWHRRAILRGAAVEYMISLRRRRESSIDSDGSMYSGMIRKRFLLQKELLLLIRVRRFGKDVKIGCAAENRFVSDRDPALIESSLRGQNFFLRQQNMIAISGANDADRKRRRQVN